MSEWKERKLEDVVQLKRGFDLATRNRRSGPFPVVGSAGISGWHNEGPIPGPALVLGRAGASMGVASYCETERFWPLNTALFAEDFKGNDPRFIFHLFQVTDLTGFNSGSVQPMLNRNYIRNVTVRIPGLNEQRAISMILGALDDKIAVNEAVSETTRVLARAYFRAAVESADAYDVELSSVVEFLNRGVAPRYTEDESQLRVLNQKCVREGRVNLTPSRRTLSDKVPDVKLLRMCDVLVNSTGTGTLGRLARWTRQEVCTVDSHITIVRFDAHKADPVCAGFAMLNAQSEIEALGEGSTGQTELGRTQLSAVRIIMPSRDRASRLRPVLDALESRGDSALEESDSLASLRDTLLPKLMSGEIRVRDAEKVVEEVT
jgi:restriction endonuclease S subunit